MRTVELLETGRGALIDLDQTTGLRERVAGWSDRVERVGAHAEARPAGTLLLRPDGYVAAATDPGSSHAIDDLATALTQWFETPTTTATD